MCKLKLLAMVWYVTTSRLTIKHLDKASYSLEEASVVITGFLSSLTLFNTNFAGTLKYINAYSTILYNNYDDATENAIISYDVIFYKAL